MDAQSGIDGANAAFDRAVGREYEAIAQHVAAARRQDELAALCEAVDRGGLVSTPFAVTLRAEGGTAVVFVSGEVDLGVSQKFAEVGRLALASQGSAVVFDLADLAFMDSTGLNAMVRIHQAVREAGKSFSLRSVSERTQRLLKLCGLEYLLGPD